MAIYDLLAVKFFFVCNVCNALQAVEASIEPVSAGYNNTHLMCRGVMFAHAHTHTLSIDAFTHT